jgi:hypothetical protein
VKVVEVQLDQRGADPESPRKLTASTPRHNSSTAIATVRTIETMSDVVVAEGLSPYCLSNAARRRRYGKAKKAN